MQEGSLEGHSDVVISVEWSPNANQVASVSDDHSVRIWDTATGQCTRVMMGHSSSVFSVKWSPDGKQVASDSADKLVRIWDVATEECHVVLSASDGFPPAGFQKKLDANAGLDCGSIVSVDCPQLKIHGSRAVGTWNKFYPLFFELKH